LEKIIDEHSIDEVYFSYSDVSYKYVMGLASRAQAHGASFVLLGPNETMLKSKKRIIAVTAVRTGCGKSPLTRKIATILKDKKIKFVIIRHPMPYGDLVKQKMQRFATLADLDKNECTIEEREEYEPHIKNGIIVYAGVDYGEILKHAEQEADVIIWDGGNNDMSFIKPDLQFVVTDALRPGHEVWYYPGETNFRAADVIIINKASENPTDIERIMKNIEICNPNAQVLETDMELIPDEKISIKGKNVIVVEDGPTVTHGGMKFGAGYEYAKKHGAKIVDPKKHAVGSLKKVYEEYDHLENVLPAMGYYGEQINDLAESINKSGAEIVVSGTPIDITKVLKVKIPVLHINYVLKERTGNIEGIIEEFLD